MLEFDMSQKNYSFVDYLLIQCEQGIRTLFSSTKKAQRPNPSHQLSEASLSPLQRRKSAGLMRINHVGEVCAQALYQGQAITARSSKIKEAMEQAAQEEVDHLVWCEERLNELNSRPSYLNPGWYFGALCLGLLAGLLGDQWSLGFVAETEKQVVEHLQNHLNKLPLEDNKSKIILKTMCEDEAKHATVAQTQGAAELPDSVKWMMKIMSNVMTTTAYWI